jgi:succinate dehydrogenase / fumarate reductase flavoprotein subunit
VHELARDFTGVDIITDPVAIQPTAHYSMGGIPAGADCQVIADANNTPVVGFYAAGECACISVHGANRLGTNSLLDASLFGRRAGLAMAEFIKGGAALQPVSGDPVARNQARLARYTNGAPGKEAESVAAVAAALKETMTKNVGVFRDGARLQVAQDEVQALQERFVRAQIMDKGSRFNTELLAAIETEHLLTFSEVIVASALARTESRGAHYRTDHTKRDDVQWLKHTLAHKNGADAPRLDYKDVTIFWDRYPPQERKY